MKGETVMQDITKALNDFAKAVESNDTVAYVKVTISLKKLNSQNQIRHLKMRKNPRQRGSENAPPRKSIIAYIFNKSMFFEVIIE